MAELYEWLRGVHIAESRGSLRAKVSEVVCDSRQAAPGCVLVCMRGAKADSHDFIPQAYAAGCRVFITDRPVDVLPDMTVVVTENTRKALAYISAARRGYPAKKLLMIGITGTKGKTSTAHMVKAVLEAGGKKTGMIGTNGVYIGDVHYHTVNTTPESCDLHRYFAEMTAAGLSCCVMEVSSQALKLDRTAGITFDLGIFTNISPDHIGPDEHRDFAEYLACKRALFKQCRFALVNADDPEGARLLADAPCPMAGFAVKADADYRADDVRCFWDPEFVGVSFTLAGRQSFPVKVGLPGRFNVSNALAAVSAGLQAGVSPAQVSRALEHIKISGRMEIVYSAADCCIIVDYAHNAVSMKSLLTTLREYSPKRLVVVFGCGGNRSKDRRYSMGEIAGRLADFSIITADNSRFERVEDIMADIRSSIEKTGGAFIEIADRREAIRYAVMQSLPGDMIAVIGKGHEDYQEVNGIRHHFLDREVVEEAVREWKK